jgi:hypothetical protein
MQRPGGEPFFNNLSEVRDMHRAANLQHPTSVAFPTGVDVRWEAEVRVQWNERERVAEEQELIYEVSWISEIGVWRRFLRSRRKVQ